MSIRSGIIAAFAVALLAPLGAVRAGDTDTAPKAAAKENKENNEAKKEETKCDAAPGSRIKLSKPEECKKLAKQPFRSYSKEELDTTGEMDVGDALRKLDPAVR
jgi:hypothetical protein